jgi:succinate dehydrogenase/fumarate reductase flavoprotein subunit
VPGLLAAGLAQAGCANHFAGFHIGLCVGNGWIAGRSAIEDLDWLPAPDADVAAIQMLHAETMKPLTPAAETQSDRILRDLQQIMFAYDVGILKRADRLDQATAQVEALSREFDTIAAPHIHELVRLKETEAMLLAARMILGASLLRTESRLSHFREDYETRDDENWLAWVDVVERNGDFSFERTPIPTPLCSVGPVRRPTRLNKQNAVGGVG